MLLSLALLGLAAIVGLALVELVIRRTDVGAGMVLGVMLLGELALVDLTLISSPVQVNSGDAMFIVLITAAVARFLRLERLTTPQRLMVLFGMLVAFAMYRGAGSFGVPAVINEGRKFLRFVAGVLYFSTLEPRHELLDRIGRFWLVAAAALAGLALLRWVANTAGLTGGLFGEGEDLRVLPATGALVIAQGAMIALPMLMDRARGHLRYLAPVLLVVLVLLQHRTVWLVTIAGLVYLMFRERMFTARVLAALAVGGVVFTGLVVTVFDDAEIGEDLAASSQSTGTFEWRMAGWQALLEDSGPETTAEVAVGAPFGGGWERRFDGMVIEVSPHNWYVEAYLRVGAVGIAAMLLIYAVALRGAPRPARRRGGPSQPPGALTHNVLQTIVGVQLLYYITYTPDLAQSMLLGLGCAAAAGAALGRTARTPLEVATR